MTESHVDPPRKRWRVFLVLGGLFGLIPGLIIAAAYGVFYAQSKAELDAEIAKIRARGEPVWCSEISLGSTDALAAGDRLYKLMAGLSRPSEEFFTRLQAEPPTPPGDYPEFRTALAERRELLAAIVQAARYPGIRFRYDLDAKQILLRQVDKLHPVYSLLRADVLQSLGTGNDARAVEAIGEGLDLARVLRDDPWLVSRLVYWREANRMLDLLETALGQVRFARDERRTLDNRLEAMESEFRLASAIPSERAALMTTMNTAGSREFGELLDSSLASASKLTIRNRAWTNFWWGTTFFRPRLRHEQAFMLRMKSRMATVIDQPGLAGKIAQNRFDADLTSQLAHLPINSLFPWKCDEIRRLALDFRQRLIAARLALRVCHYRAQQGKWPESLEMVLDKELPALPKGLFSDRPLVYDVEDDGFAIYDVDPDDQEPRGRFAVKGVKSE